MALDMRTTTTSLMILAVVVLAVPRRTEAAISCSSVGSALFPCVSYVIGKQSFLSAGCCSGVNSLYRQVMTTKDRQTVCSCLKSLVATIKGVDFDKAAGLPAKCGVSIPYKFSRSTDCSKVR